MRHTSVILAVAAFVLGGLVGVYALLAERPLERGAALGAMHPAWSEMQWPFPIDQWGKGKAFHCKASDCGSEVSVYVRAKIGFCNCSTGVSDDEELDRISDYDLLGSEPAAFEPGRPIAIGWMKGRSRAFRVGAQEAGASALIDRIQRSLRCRRRHRGAGTRANSRAGAGGDRIPQQQNRAAMGRCYARALIRRVAAITPPWRRRTRSPWPSARSRP